MRTCGAAATIFTNTENHHPRSKVSKTVRATTVIIMCIKPRKGFVHPFAVASTAQNNEPPAVQACTSHFRHLQNTREQNGHDGRMLSGHGPGIISTPAADLPPSVRGENGKRIVVAIICWLTFVCAVFYRFFLSLCGVSLFSALPSNMSHLVKKQGTDPRFL